MTENNAPPPPMTLEDLDKAVSEGPYRTLFITPHPLTDDPHVMSQVSTNLRTLVGKNSIPATARSNRHFCDPGWVHQAIIDNGVDPLGTNLSPKVWMMPNGISHPRGVSHTDYYDYHEPIPRRINGKLLEGLTPL